MQDAQKVRTHQFWNGGGNWPEILREWMGLRFRHVLIYTPNGQATITTDTGQRSNHHYLVLRPESVCLRDRLTLLVEALNLAIAVIDEPTSIDEMPLEYPVTIMRVDDEGDKYYLAFYPDFGHCACSAVGSTVEETFLALEGMKQDLFSAYKEKGWPIPKPTADPSQLMQCTFPTA